MTRATSVFLLLMPPDFIAKVSDTRAQSVTE
jgi:hypothetical protein